MINVDRGWRGRERSASIASHCSGSGTRSCNGARPTDCRTLPQLVPAEPGIDDLPAALGPRIASAATRRDRPGLRPVPVVIHAHLHGDLMLQRLAFQAKAVAAGRLDVDVAVSDADRLTGKADQALDVADLGFLGIAKDDHVPSLGGARSRGPGAGRKETSSPGCGRP